MSGNNGKASSGNSAKPSPRFNVNISSPKAQALNDQHNLIIAESTSNVNKHLLERIKLEQKEN